MLAVRSFNVLFSSLNHLHLLYIGTIISDILIASLSAEFLNDSLGSPVPFFIDLNYLQRFFEKHWCFLLIFAPIICPSVSLPQTSVEYTELQCYIFEHIQELLQFHDEENFKIQ